MNYIYVRGTKRVNENDYVEIIFSSKTSYSDEFLMLKYVKTLEKSPSRLVTEEYTKHFSNGQITYVKHVNGSSTDIQYLDSVPEELLLAMDVLNNNDAFDDVISRGNSQLDPTEVLLDKINSINEKSL